MCISSWGVEELCTSKCKRNNLTLDLYSSSVMLCGPFPWDSLSTLVHLEGRLLENQYKIDLSNYLYPKMKHFYESGLFQDDGVTIHTA